MPVAVSARWERVSYLLTVSAIAGQQELLRWTIATAAVTAGPGVVISQTLLDLLTRRLRDAISGIAAGDLEDQINILPSLCNVRDAAGLAVASMNIQDGYHALEVGPLDAARTYYLLLSFPHPVGAPLC